MTWNPIVGCSIISSGCTNCYAMKMARRQEVGFKTPHYQGTTTKVNGNAVWTGQVNLAPEHILTKPLSWKKPRMVFVNSMSDLFHEDVPDSWIDHVFLMMWQTPQHTYQVLTKRADRMKEYILGFEQRRAIFDCHAGLDFCDWPLSNVWLGISAEDQRRADERIPDLLDTPAAVRFVSIEPQLGPVDLTRIAHQTGHPSYYQDAVAGFISDTMQCQTNKIDWCIVGCESGPKRRPFNEDWARSLRDQCQAAGTAFFYKQRIETGRKVETPELDGRVWTQFPQAPLLDRSAA